MAVVKINAIEVPEGAGPELERRFAARHGSVTSAPGFLSFELLRPVTGDVAAVLQHLASRRQY